MPLPSHEGAPLDTDAVARGLAELEFDARVALPEAQERFKRAEDERDRYRKALLEVADVYHDSVLTNAQAQDKTIGIVTEALTHVGKPDARDVARGEELAREHGWQ